MLDLFCSEALKTSLWQNLKGATLTKTLTMSLRPRHWRLHK